MKASVSCPKCEDVQRRRDSISIVGDESHVQPNSVEVELVSGDVAHDEIRLSCSHGHVSQIALRIPPHQVLFEFALSAFLDSYYRDSVTSAAVALERFKEWAVKLLFASRGLSPDLAKTWWSRVGRRSEAQDGSYIAAWMLVLGEAPAPDEAMKETRNKCVHQGFIPPREEAAKFVEWTLRYLVRGEIVVRNAFGSLTHFDSVEHELYFSDSNKQYGFALQVDENAVNSWRRAERDRITDAFTAAEVEAEEQGRVAEFETPPEPKECPADIADGAKNRSLEKALERVALWRGLKLSGLTVTRSV